MNNILQRDINGICDGDCRDLVKEHHERLQQDLNSIEYSSGVSPSVPWAHDRTEQPGIFGGHV